MFTDDNGNPTLFEMPDRKIVTPDNGPSAPSQQTDGSGETRRDPLVEDQLEFDFNYNIGVEKVIVDTTCGSRSIWFDKTNRHTVYVDRRDEHHEGVFGKTQPAHRTLDIHPDVMADFTNLPFKNETFWHVVWDPPHFVNASDSQWYCKAYGTLRKDNWKEVIYKGFCECWRILKTNGTLVFKWNEVSISTPEIVKVLPIKPLYGHRSGKKAGTHWMVFVKTEDDPDFGNWDGGLDKSADS